MSNFTTFMSASGGGKPARVTRYTSGSGTFVPLSYTTSYARVTILAGGGAGREGPWGTGGGGGGMHVFWQWLWSNEPYVVGAGGSRTRFGKMVVEAGSVGDFDANRGGQGGRAGYSIDYNNNVPAVSSISGISGGQGGKRGIGGNAPNFTGNPGFSSIYFGNGLGSPGSGFSDPDYGTAYAGGAGGDSMYGVGGNGGSGDIYTLGISNGANGGGYGAGGGGGCRIDYNPPGHGDYGAINSNGGSGSGGLIIIEEFTF